MDHSVHRPDRVNMKACRWIQVRACACACIFDIWMCVGRAGCQRKTEKCRGRERESTTTTHAYCTARVCLCVSAQWGFLGADLSEFCCVSSSAGNMNIHEVLLSLVKASCRSTGAARGAVRWGGGEMAGGTGFVCTAEVNQCFICRFHLLASGRAGGGPVNQDGAFTFCMQVCVFLSLSRSVCVTLRRHW